MPRFYCPVPLVAGLDLGLPAAAARHVQVLRLQPGHTITLFNGEGGEWDATITRMGRSEVDVCVGAHRATEREPARAVHLAVGMPANERMDWLVEKAAELGVASVQPLQTAHSVLRLAGERAEKKRQHWQSVASSACEQCGGNRVPVVHAVASLGTWLSALPPADPTQLRCLLSLSDDATPFPLALNDAGGASSVVLLSGPEGGLGRQEEEAAEAAGFLPVTLGSRVLRAETASMAALVLATAL